jgi:iron complex outermembrane receptor protein
VRFSLFTPWLCAGVLSPSLAMGQPTELQPLTITAPRTSSAWWQTPAAVGVVEAGDLPGEQSLALDRLLAPVPGVFAQDRYNFAQGLRLSIRGFGARANFGVRGVRVLVDGVPLTMPDGQTELDGLDLGLVERVQVLRGPASTLYGNAAGGVLLIDTREPPEQPQTRVDMSGGELGYHRMRAETGGTAGDLGGLLAFNATQLDGYRQHNHAETNSITGKLRWQADAGRLGLNFNAIDNRAEDPGGLTAAEVRGDRDQAAPNNLRYDADEAIRQQRLSLVWDGEAPGDDDYQLRGYVGHREFGNSLAFTSGGQTTFERDFAGLGAQYTHRATWFGLAHRLTGGIDVESQRDDRRRYDNLLGTRGAETLRQDESADSSGVFLEDEIALSQRWLASLGVRYDRVRLAVDDRFLADGSDDSGSRALQDWNYSAGLSYRLDDHHQLYARLATSFETPTVNELGNPAGGGFNPSLGPAEALNRELGLKGEWSQVRYELALFSMRIDEELVSYSLPGQPGRSFYRNAGKSRRDGMEASLDWRLAEHWRVLASYAWSDFRFQRYRPQGADYDGNRVAGIPRQALFAELGYERAGWYARVNASAYGQSYADDGNSERVGGYALFNARIGRRFDFGEQSVEPYLGLDNLAGRDYFDNVRINDANRRYYEPGPGRTFYVGLRATF